MPPTPVKPRKANGVEPHGQRSVPWLVINDFLQRFRGRLRFGAIANELGSTSRTEPFMEKMMAQSLAELVSSGNGFLTSNDKKRDDTGR
jgi:hypothetical protein